MDFRTVAGYDTGEKFVCGDFVYQLNSDDNTAYTVSYNGVGTDIVVPDKLDDHTVTAIGDFTFNFQDKIQTVQLPDTVISIGNMAFYQCTALKSIVIPDVVTKIDQCCFGGCSAL